MNEAYGRRYTRPMPRLETEDTLTLAALGALAFVAADVTHEALGHGLASLATGATPVMLTSCYFSTSGTNSRWIPAAGGLANLVFGLLALWLLRVVRRQGPHLRFFLFLTAAFNLLFAAAYPAYSGIAAFGDWAAVIAGLSPAWAWRLLLVSASVAGYWLSLRVLASAVQPFCGSAQALRRLRRITMIPFLAALVVAGAAGVLNPQGWETLFRAALPAAAGSFGMTQLDHFAALGEADPNPAGIITRNWGWIAAGILVGAGFVAILGPGIPFGAHP
jgi:hypothetical protein